MKSFAKLENTLRIVLVAGLIHLLMLGLPGCGGSASLGIPAMKLVSLEKSKVVVEDGDTFVYNGQRVRMLGIDTPEVDSPYHEGNQDPHGTEAKHYLMKRVMESDSIQMIRIPELDPYDRMLAYLILDGQNVCAEIVEAGLAYESVTHYGPQGLDRYAVEVLDAAKRQPPPQFEKPWEWRKKHRKQAK